MSPPGARAVHCVTLPTNGLAYPRLLFDLDALQSRRDLLNLPVLLFLLGKVDTAAFSATQFETLEGECCSGLQFAAQRVPQRRDGAWRFRCFASVSTSLLSQAAAWRSLRELLASALQNEQLAASLERAQVRVAAACEAGAAEAARGERGHRAAEQRRPSEPHARAGGGEHGGVRAGLLCGVSAGRPRELRGRRFCIAWRCGASRRIQSGCAGIFRKSCSRCCAACSAVTT